MAAINQGGLSYFFIRKNYKNGSRNKPQQNYLHQFMLGNINASALFFYKL